ncbi:otoferlin [Trichonephila inaurata madagascariensis]|uniref:Otoferlin n=1 Tax=Trichonephila inaurata madagascariensis TaxID=2747483 RepID=A0A8X6YQR9_9ARAC|nr:otoferlin [Trichonephila inaurata madagascariensis]
MVIPRASLPTAFLEGLSAFRDIDAETDMMQIKNKDVMAFVVYPCELENVPEFGGFQEWLNSFELIKGKRSHWSSKSEKVMAILKGCFRIYKTPLPPHVMDPSLPITEGEEGLFGGLPSNKPTKVLIRAYMVKALNLKPSDVTNTTDAYIVLLLGKQRLSDKEHYISKQQNPVFGRCFEFVANFPQDCILHVQLFDWNLVGSDALIGETVIDLENRFYSKHRPTCGLARVYETFAKGLETFSRDDIYNVDETGINWKALPKKSIASKRESTAPGFKVSKESVTAMVCANASRTHTLPLLVIDKSKKPRCFKNVSCLPTLYKAQKSTWMNSAHFSEWYSKVFIPNVKKLREREGKTGKVLLILDNAPCHPCVEILNAIDDDFSVMYLLPNVTALVQPMDQGVIVKLKTIYRKRSFAEITFGRKRRSQQRETVHWTGCAPLTRFPPSGRASKFEAVTTSQFRKRLTHSYRSLFCFVPRVNKWKGGREKRKKTGYLTQRNELFSFLCSRWANEDGEYGLESLASVEGDFARKVFVGPGAP